MRALARQHEHCPHISPIVCVSMAHFVTSPKQQSTSDQTGLWATTSALKLSLCSAGTQQKLFIRLVPSSVQLVYCVLFGAVWKQVRATNRLKLRGLCL